MPPWVSERTRGREDKGAGHLLGLQRLWPECQEEVASSASTAHSFPGRSKTSISKGHQNCTGFSLTRSYGKFPTDQRNWLEDKCVQEGQANQKTPLIDR